MFTVREACKIIEQHTGTEDVAQWATELRLVGLLPDVDHPLSAEDAARLLIAVLASWTPEHVVKGCENMSGTKLSVVHVHAYVPGVWGWRQASPNELGDSPQTVLEALTNEIECYRDGLRLGTEGLAKLTVFLREACVDIQGRTSIVRSFRD